MTADKKELIEGEREFTDAQVEECGRLMQELPSIESAIKNYLSMRLAEGLSPSIDADMDGAAAATATSSASMATSLQGCARVILIACNALELPAAPEWSHRHPQGEDESGMDFIARIGSYKVVQHLLTKARSAGQKPAKMLGKSALRFVLPAISSQLLENIASSATSAKASESDFQSFLAGFEAALAGDASDPASVSAIVWCVDMRSAVAERQKLRKAEAEERVARQKSAETFSAELRETLAGHVPPNSTSSVQIEEVAQDSQ
jgi:hypothetical protein